MKFNQIIVTEHLYHIAKKQLQMFGVKELRGGSRISNGDGGGGTNGSDAVGAFWQNPMRKQKNWVQLGCAPVTTTVKIH